MSFTSIRCLLPLLPPYLRPGPHHFWCASDFPVFKSGDSSSQDLSGPCGPSPWTSGPATFPVIQGQVRMQNPERMATRALSGRQPQLMYFLGKTERSPPRIRSKARILSHRFCSAQVLASTVKDEKERKMYLGCKGRCEILSIACLCIHKS